MKKRIILIALLSTMLLTTSMFAAGIADFEIFSPTIMWGWVRPLELKEPVFIKDGTTYVALRDFCSAIGIEAEWNGEKQTIQLNPYYYQVPVYERYKKWGVEKEEGVIPDEETALKIGKIILETYLGRPVEYQADDLIYFLECRYFPNENCWSVYQSCKDKYGMPYLVLDGHSIAVSLNKTNGQVQFICPYSDVEDTYNPEVIPGE